MSDSTAHRLIIHLSHGADIAALGDSYVEAAERAIEIITRHSLKPRDVTYLGQSVLDMIQTTH